MKFKKTFLVSTKNQKQMMCVYTHIGMYRKGKKSQAFVFIFFTYIFMS